MRRENERAGKLRRIRHRKSVWTLTHTHTANQSTLNTSEIVICLDRRHILRNVFEQSVNVRTVE